MILLTAMLNQHLVAIPEQIFAAEQLDWKGYNRESSSLPDSCSA